jgi:FkbM family methyltransferase
MKKLNSTVIDFSEGKIDKKTYIKEMHELHHFKLFDYAKYIKNTNIKKIEITDDSVIMTSRDHGIKISCSTYDFRIAPIEILNFKEYEKSDSDMMFNLMEHCQNFFDIGANIGWYSINIALAYKKANIYSFEPIPSTYQQLLGNISLNQIQNITTFNFGFSNIKGVFPFYFYHEGSGNASTRNLTELKNVESIDCKLCKLDDFIDEKRIKIDFIKCDVEGGELLVFKGGALTIARDKPIVFSEILRKWSAKFGYNPNDIFNLFYSMNYRAFTSSGSGLKEFFKMDEATIETNFFFLHADKHRHLIHLYTN